MKHSVMPLTPMELGISVMYTFDLINHFFLVIPFTLHKIYNMQTEMMKQKCFIDIYLKTSLFLRTKFLQNSALVRSRFEVALMTSKLDPGVPLLLVGLKEWCPLHNVAKLTPSLRLLKWRKNKLSNFWHILIFVMLQIN